MLAAATARALTGEEVTFSGHLVEDYCCLKALQFRHRGVQPCCIGVHVPDETTCAISTCVFLAAVHVQADARLLQEPEGLPELVYRPGPAVTSRLFFLVRLLDLQRTRTAPAACSLFQIHRLVEWYRVQAIDIPWTDHRCSVQRGAGSAGRWDVLLSVISTNDAEKAVWVAILTIVLQSGLLHSRDQARLQDHYDTLGGPVAASATVAARLWTPAQGQPPRPPLFLTLESFVSRQGLQHLVVFVVDGMRALVEENAVESVRSVRLLRRLMRALQAVNKLCNPFAYVDAQPVQCALEELEPLARQHRDVAPHYRSWLEDPGGSDVIPEPYPNRLLHLGVEAVLTRRVSEGEELQVPTQNCPLYLEDGLRALLQLTPRSLEDQLDWLTTWSFLSRWMDQVLLEMPDQDTVRPRLEFWSRVGIWSRRTGQKVVREALDPPQEPLRDDTRLVLLRYAGVWLTAHEHAQLREASRPVLETSTEAKNIFPNETTPDYYTPFRTAWKAWLQWVQKNMVDGHQDEKSVVWSMAWSGMPPSLIGQACLTDLNSVALQEWRDRVRSTLTDRHTLLSMRRGQPRPHFHNMLHLYVRVLQHWIWGSSSAVRVVEPWSLRYAPGWPDHLVEYITQPDKSVAVVLLPYYCHTNLRWGLAALDLTERCLRIASGGSPLPEELQRLLMRMGCMNWIRYRVDDHAEAAAAPRPRTKLPSFWSLLHTLETSVSSITTTPAFPDALSDAQADHILSRWYLWCCLWRRGLLLGRNPPEFPLTGAHTTHNWINPHPKRFVFVTGDQKTTTNYLQDRSASDGSTMLCVMSNTRPEETLARQFCQDTDYEYCMLCPYPYDRNSVLFYDQNLFGTCEPHTYLFQDKTVHYYHLRGRKLQTSAEDDVVGWTVCFLFERPTRETIEKIQRDIVGTSSLRGFLVLVGWGGWDSAECPEEHGGGRCDFRVVHFANQFLAFRSIHGDPWFQVTDNTQLDPVARILMADFETLL